MARFAGEDAVSGTHSVLDEPRGSQGTTLHAALALHCVYHLTTGSGTGRSAGTTMSSHGVRLEQGPFACPLSSRRAGWRSLRRGAQMESSAGRRRIMVPNWRSNEEKT